MPDKKYKVVIVAGPTASGKTAFSIEYAKDLNQDCVVINADSMQIYNALHILTAQPSEAERSAVPHRLFGILDPSISCTATHWRSLALAEIDKAIEAGQQPILVGGTGFYMKALMDGLSPIPDIDEALHLAVIEEGAEDLSALYKELEIVDPQTAARLNPNDTQRICRAVEVYRDTQKPLSWWQGQPLVEAPEHLVFELIVMQPERTWLYERINARVHKMVKEGALEEVEALMKLSEQGNISEHNGVVKALGFQEFRSYLRGEKSLEAAIEKTQIDSRQYAKRQDTWFRHQLKEGGNIIKHHCKVIPAL